MQPTLFYAKLSLSVYRQRRQPCHTCLFERHASVAATKARSPFREQKSIYRSCETLAIFHVHRKLTRPMAGAPSPSDRIQMLSQPRRSSTGTARSVHSVSEIATPASQASHWQTQHSYAHHVSSPHGEAPAPMDVSTPHHDARWSPHPSSHPQHHGVSMAEHPSVHAVEAYPSSYGMESNARAMSYPLDNAPLVTSQPMQMTGYGTPTSHPSPHASEYQRHMSLPMNHQVPPQSQHPHAHAQQQTSAPYPSYAHQGYAPQVSHPGDMPMMAHDRRKTDRC